MTSYLRGSDNFSNFGGKILQNKRVFSTTWQSIASTSLVDLSNLSITMTPIQSTSTIFLRAFISSNLVYVNSFTFLKDGAKTISGVGSNSNESDTHLTFYSGNSPTAMASWMIQHSETSGTSSRTYTVAGTSGWAGTAYTLYINGRNSNDMQSSCTFEAFEVAA